MSEFKVPLDSFLSPDEQSQARAGFINVLGLLRNKVKPLSTKDRQSLRKMGNRRLAYVEATAEVAEQQERFLPRDINAADMLSVLKQHRQIRELRVIIEEINEALDDHQMALGVDLMIYAGIIHSALRSANQRNPVLDSILARLDEFFKRAQAEEAEEGLPPLENEEPIL
jgi:hypothetical protein